MRGSLDYFAARPVLARGRVLALAFALVACAVPSQAQTLRLGIGAVIADNDDANRVRNPARDENIFKVRWPLRAVVYVVPRIGLGVEHVRLGKLDTVVSSHASFRQTDFEEESVTLATGHVRVLASRLFALEVIGGLGKLRSHRALRTYTPPSSLTPMVFTEDASMRALMGGAEFMVRALSHLSVGPSARVYSLHRPQHTSGGITSNDSTLMSFGVVADFVW